MFREPLTDRQLEVARLITAGRTNPEIAKELGISLDGAKYHVSELLGRLGLRTRAEVAAWYTAEATPSWRTRLVRMLLPVGALAAAGGGATAATAILVMVIVNGSQDGGLSTPAEPAAAEAASGLALQLAANDSRLLAPALRPTSAMSVPNRTGHSATLLNDGRVLVAGGEAALDGSPSAALSNAEVYDPVGDTWTLLDLPRPLSGHDAVLLPDGRVMLAGANFGEAGTEALLFDPVTGSVEEKRSPFGTLSGIVLVDERVVGRLDTPAAHGELVEFLSAPDRWEALAASDTAKTHDFDDMTVPASVVLTIRDLPQTEPTVGSISTSAWWAIPSSWFTVDTPEGEVTTMPPSTDGSAPLATPTPSGTPLALEPRSVPPPAVDTSSPFPPAGELIPLALEPVLANLAQVRPWIGGAVVLHAPDATPEEHQQIVDALAAGDEFGAEQLALEVARVRGYGTWLIGPPESTASADNSGLTRLQFEDPGVATVGGRRLLLLEGSPEIEIVDVTGFDGAVLAEIAVRQPTVTRLNDGSALLVGGTGPAEALRWTP